MSQRHIPRYGGLLVGLLSLTLLLLGHQLFVAHASPSIAPTVTYVSSLNTIYIGSNSGAPDSESVTIPDLVTALTGLGFNDLLVSQPNNVWLLKASIIISPTGQLVATSPVTELHLDSPSIDTVTQKPLNLTAIRGGHLVIDGIKISAWENGVLDTNITNGRSYLLAFGGGRMDITHSEIFNLGYANGERSGLSWRTRLNTLDPKTGSTGTLTDSDIHDNYFGMYSFAAYNVKILSNHVHHNLFYGIDPHDDSENLEVAFNEVDHNGKHGIIFSRNCINNHIHHNIVHDNADHGIMMDRGSNNNLIENNTVYNNDDGFSIFESSGNTLLHNTAHSNNRGVRINATFDATDVFDGISSDNQVISNTLTDNKQYGIYLYARADRNVIADNQIISTTLNGIYIKSGGNLIQNNLVQRAGIGITILGGDLPAHPKPNRPYTRPAKAIR